MHWSQQKEQNEKPDQKEQWRLTIEFKFQWVTVTYLERLGWALNSFNNLSKYSACARSAARRCWSSSCLVRLTSWNGAGFVQVFGAGLGGIYVKGNHATISDHLWKTPLAELRTGPIQSAKSMIIEQLLLESSINRASNWRWRLRSSLTYNRRFGSIGQRLCLRDTSSCLSLFPFYLLLNHPHLLGKPSVLSHPKQNVSSSRNTYSDMLGDLSV